MAVTAPKSLSTPSPGGVIGLFYTDPNGSLSIPVSTWVLTSSGLLTPWPVDANGNPIISIGASGITVPVDVQSRYFAALASTTTALAASASFTSAWVQCSNYERIYASMYSDQSGTLEIDFSNDGTNADIHITLSYTGGSVTNNYIIQERMAPYVRLVVTNGATAETTLRAYMWAQP